MRFTVTRWPGSISASTPFGCTRRASADHPTVLKGTRHPIASISTDSHVARTTAPGLINSVADLRGVSYLTIVCSDGEVFALSVRQPESR